MRHLEPVRGGLAAMRAAIVDHPEDAIGRTVGFDGHDLIDQASERLDTGRRFQPPEQLGPVDIPGGQVGPGAAAGVFVLHTQGPARPGGGGWMAAQAGLEGGLLVGADHVLAGAESFAFELAGVEIEDPTGLGAEVGVAGEDPAPMAPGPDGVLRQPLPDGGTGDAGHEAAVDDLGLDVGNLEAGALAARVARAARTRSP